MGGLWLSSGYLTASDNLISLSSYQVNLTANAVLETDVFTYQPVTFQMSGSTEDNTQSIIYTSTDLSLQADITPKADLGAACLLLSIRVDYHSDLLLHDLSLNLAFPENKPLQVLQGIKAVEMSSEEYNRNQLPYTDKVMEYRSPQASFWIVASNYADCAGVERLTPNTIYLYDHTLHYARQYRPVTQSFDRLKDSKPVQTGQTDTFSFLIFTERPVLTQVNRWLGDKAAALSISNDADFETIQRLQASFFGSTNHHSPKYLTAGLAAKHLHITNSVFGCDIDSMSVLWQQIRAAGNTIAYHSYATYADMTACYAQSLLQDMLPYNIRLWIDHGWVENPEDFCCEGDNPLSPYYLIGVINQTAIDYAWWGESLRTNTFNAFDLPCMLPHRLYANPDLLRPIYFFGRTVMETWEYCNELSYLDMKHNLTSDNLDRLIADNGLCVIYTHLCFNETTAIKSFYQYLPNGACEVKDEVNERFALLDYYQKQRGLWIAPVEEIFDRLLAIEQVRIVRVTDAEVPGFLAVTYRNDSDMELQHLCLYYGDRKILIDILPAYADYILYLRKPQTNEPVQLAPVLKVCYKNATLYLNSVNGEPLNTNSMSIFNAKGQLLERQPLTAGLTSYTIPCPLHSSGIYLVRLQLGAHHTITRRFTVIQ